MFKTTLFSQEIDALLLSMGLALFVVITWSAMRELYVRLTNFFAHLAKKKTGRARRSSARGSREAIVTLGSTLSLLALVSLASGIVLTCMPESSRAIAERYGILGSYTKAAKRIEDGIDVAHERFLEAEKHYKMLKTNNAPEEKLSIARQKRDRRYKDYLAVNIIAVFEEGRTLDIPTSVKWDIEQWETTVKSYGERLEASEIVSIEIPEEFDFRKDMFIWLECTGHEFVDGGEVPPGLIIKQCTPNRDKEKIVNTVSDGLMPGSDVATAPVGIEVDPALVFDQHTSFAFLSEQEHSIDWQMVGNLLFHYRKVGKYKQTTYFQTQLRDDQWVVCYGSRESGDFVALDNDGYWEETEYATIETGYDEKEKMWYITIEANKPHTKGAYILWFRQEDGSDINHRKAVEEVVTEIGGTRLVW